MDFLKFDSWFISTSTDTNKMMNARHTLARTHSITISIAQFITEKFQKYTESHLLPQQSTTQCRKWYHRRHPSETPDIDAQFRFFINNILDCILCDIVCCAFEFMHVERKPIPIRISNGKRMNSREEKNNTKHTHKRTHKSIQKHYYCECHWRSKNYRYKDKTKVGKRFACVHACVCVWTCKVVEGNTYRWKTTCKMEKQLLLIYGLNCRKAESHGTELLEGAQFVLVLVSIICYRLVVKWTFTGRTICLFGW